MRWARSAFASFVVAALSMGAVAACFPSFTFGAPGDGGIESDTGSNDATVVDGNGPTPDGSTPGDGAPPSDARPPGDGGAVDGPVDSNDSGLPWDGGPFDATATGVIPSGMYFFQSSVEGIYYVDSSVTLTYSYAVDDYEVTVGRFGGWVEAGLPVPADGTPLDSDPNAFKSVMLWSADWDTLAQTPSWDTADTSCVGAVTGPVKTYPMGADGGEALRYPVSCVSWYSALAFCAWEGKRLMTETEWRVAATGRENLLYPWGNSPDPDCAHVIFDPEDGGYCGYPVPVGTAAAGVSRDGLFDLTGSLEEWVWDAVNNGAAYPANPGVNYAGPPFPEGGVIGETDHGQLGGSWAGGGDQAYFETSTVQTGAGATPVDAVGFRCAQSR